MKNSIYIPLVIALVFVAFMLGYFCGHNSIDERLQIQVDTRPDTIGQINLNTATMDDLVQIPGISEITAQRIIDYRTRKGDFTSVDELCNVSGITEKKLEDIRYMLRVE